MRRPWLVLRLPWPRAADRSRERTTAYGQESATLRAENARLRSKVDELWAALRTERRRNLDAGQVRAQRDHLKHELTQQSRRREAAERDLQTARRELDVLRKQQTGGNR